MVMASAGRVATGVRLRIVSCPDDDCGKLYVLAGCARVLPTLRERSPQRNARAVHVAFGVERLAGWSA
jgi:hypothetical protein